MSHSCFPSCADSFGRCPAHPTQTLCIRNSFLGSPDLIWRPCPFLILLLASPFPQVPWGLEHSLSLAFLSVLLSFSLGSHPALDLRDTPCLTHSTESFPTSESPQHPSREGQDSIHSVFAVLPHLNRNRMLFTVSFPIIFEASNCWAQVIFLF